jgi:hypothetical protein
MTWIEGVPPGGVASRLDGEHFKLRMSWPDPGAPP